MTFARPRFRFALMLALFAVCAQVLLPTLMRWQQSDDPVASAEICTAFGVKPVAEGSDDGEARPHCPWCVAQAAIALPSQPAYAVFALHAEAEAPPARSDLPLPPVFRRAAPPRAPPLA
ncbi:DUF2946 family protein [Methyloversatilis universalis]|uniref:DUF2946 family protein n=1 Tax=Methyloversatilis universalis TaxID=378211 RepID=UPI00047641D5|nr:DUF2946 family protein [Methyloversatilis universalis]